MQIGDRISEFRNKLGLSQIFVSNKLGISRSFYCEIEKNRRRLNIYKLPLLCKILKTTPNKVLGFKRNKVQ